MKALTLIIMALLTALYNKGQYNRNLNIKVDQSPIYQLMNRINLHSIIINNQRHRLIYIFS